MSDSPQKIYRRNRTRWIAASSVVTLGTTALGLMKDSGRLPSTVYSLSLSAMIVCWLITAVVWCTYRVMAEQRRTVRTVRSMLSEYNAAGWAAYAEQAEQSENVRPIRRG